MKFDSRHLSSTLRSVAIAVLVLATATPATWAQKDMGSIVGGVKDGTGAVVAEAKVSVTDIDHGTVFNSTTHADFLNLWNHVNPLWGPIGAAGQVEPVAIEIGTPQFGQLQAARDPRFIQFALKFYF